MYNLCPVDISIICALFIERINFVLERKIIYIGIALASVMVKCLSILDLEI